MQEELHRFPVVPCATLPTATPGMQPFDYPSTSPGDLEPWTRCRRPPPQHPGQPPPQCKDAVIFHTPGERVGPVPSSSAATHPPMTPATDAVMHAEGEGEEYQGSAGAVAKVELHSRSRATSDASAPTGCDGHELNVELLQDSTFMGDTTAAGYHGYRTPVPWQPASVPSDTEASGSDPITKATRFNVLQDARNRPSGGKLARVPISCDRSVSERSMHSTRTARVGHGASLESPKTPPATTCMSSCSDAAMHAQLPISQKTLWRLSKRSMYDAGLDCGAPPSQRPRVNAVEGGEPTTPQNSEECTRQTSGFIELHRCRCRGCSSESGRTSTRSAAAGPPSADTYTPAVAPFQACCPTGRGEPAAGASPSVCALPPAQRSTDESACCGRSGTAPARVEDAGPPAAQHAREHTVLPVKPLFAAPEPQHSGSVCPRVMAAKGRVKLKIKKRKASFAAAAANAGASHSLLPAAGGEAGAAARPTKRGKRPRGCLRELQALCSGEAPRAAGRGTGKGAKAAPGGATRVRAVHVEKCRWAPYEYAPWPRSGTATMSSHYVTDCMPCSPSVRSTRIIQASYNRHTSKPQLERRQRCPGIHWNF